MGSRETSHGERRRARPRVAALVLAAGRGSRMHGQPKLLATVAGAPLVARVVDAALASAARPVVVVTGHEAGAVLTAIEGRQGLCVVHNPDHAAGLSTSLRAGVAAVAAEVDAVLVCLADMPRLSASHLDRVLAAFEPGAARDVCLPTFSGRPGHPVLWPARCFDAIARIEGDVGARGLLQREREAGRVCPVPVEDDGIVADVDTPEDLAEARSRASGARGG